MKVIRALLFVPVCILAIGIVYLLFALLLGWFFGLSTFWLVGILIFFGGTIWALFKGLSMLLMGLTGSLSPNREFSFWVVSIFSVLWAIIVLFKSWTADIEYTGEVIFASVIFTLLVIELTFALIYGSLAVGDED